MSEERDDLSDLFEAVRHEQDQALRRSERRQSVRRRLAILEPSRPRPYGRLPLAGAGVAVLAAAALLIAYLPSVGGEPAAVAYEVGGQAREAGEFLSTTTDESMTIRFSEGSVVALEEETTARVERLTERGARLRLEHGTAEVDVRHEEETEWRIQSGPYAVHVIGTRFRVSWDAPRRDFSLVMYEGEVSVEGPFGRRSLRAGQSMHIGPDSDSALAEATTEGATPEAPVGVETEAALTNSDESATAAIPTPPEPQGASTPPTPGAASEEATAPTQAETPSPPAWREHLRAGDARAALRSIDDVGALSAAATAAELRALGTAARRAQSPIEMRLYGAIRARFPRSPWAAEAAFLSGRRAQRVGRQRAADRWFSTYLREAPSGPWAAEASGRRLETLRSLGREREAEAWARAYLSRYPAGSHSALARSMLPTE